MKYAVTALAILSINSITIATLEAGIDGAAYLTSISIIGGLGGYAVAKKTNKKD